MPNTITTMLRTPTKDHNSNPELFSKSKSSSDKKSCSSRKRKQPESEIMEAFNSLSSELRSTLQEWRCDLTQQLSTIGDSIKIIKEDIVSLNNTTSELKTNINSIITVQHRHERNISDILNKHTSFSERLNSLEASAQFNSDFHVDLEKRISSLELERSHEKIFALESKIESLEQQARHCNVEICNLPEKRNENLVELLIKIGSLTKTTLNNNNILAVHRVPHINSKDGRPKNIIAKLSSRIIRDNFLSAFRLAKGISSENLGIQGTSSRIYMNEHLTLNKKHLFRKCRDFAKTNNFKYVWVKNSTIFLRENDTSPAIAVRSHDDINKCQKTPRSSTNPVIQL